MRKNILIFGHTDATQFIDISNQYTRIFAKEFFEVTVVYLASPFDELNTKKHLSDHVIYLGEKNKSTRGLKIAAIQKMLCLYRQKKFDLVICHRYQPMYVMLCVAQFCQIPAAIFIMHELNVFKKIRRKMSLVFLWQKNMILAGVSNAVRDNMRQHIWRISAEKIITLYNAIDHERIEPTLLKKTEAREQLNLPKDDFIFGTIGRLAKAKDHVTLIKAFAAVELLCPKAKLLILGEGEERTILKQTIESLNLTHKVIMPGFIPDALRLMKALDIFILSSIQEAFGRVLLEAMLAKIPIIANHIHGIPEVIGQMGILIEAKNPIILAEKMLELYNMNHTERMQQGEQGYSRVIEIFSVNRFSDTFWQLPLIKQCEALL